MKFNKSFQVGNKLISQESPAYIIAEAGVNHGGDLNAAKKLIDMAFEAGADAVKFQSFKTENLILRNVKKAKYQNQTTDHKQSQFDMLKSLEISLAQTQDLADYASKLGIHFLTTPFDEGSLEELDRLNLSAYKISSTDLTNLGFLKRVAKKNKPIFLSTGMSFLEEVKLALQEIHPFNKNVVLLQCTANYPIKDEEANLFVLKTYLEQFDILVGYSDHSVGVGAAPYAVPLGAKVLEKHFTLDKTLEGPDHRASLDPKELKLFIKEVRKVEKYLGTMKKEPTLSEISNRKSLQKNLVAKKPLKKGSVLSENDIIAKRTGGEGISAIKINSILGKIISKDFEVDQVIEIDE